MSVTRDVLLSRGGVAQVQTLLADDEAALRSLHERLSPSSRRLRYLSTSDRPGEWYVERLMQSLPSNDALVGVVRRRLVGVASFSRLAADPDQAELCVLVDDADQHDGLGALLLEHLADLAREQGITTFVAEVLVENDQMRAVLRDSGFQTRSWTSHGVTELLVDLAVHALGRVASYAEWRRVPAGSGTTYRLPAARTSARGSASRTRRCPRPRPWACSWC